MESVSQMTPFESVTEGRSSLSPRIQEESHQQLIAEPATTYNPPNLNKNITDIFGKLRHIYDALGEDRRSFSYCKAIQVLEKLPFKISSGDQVKGLSSIGRSLEDPIREILNARTLAKLEHFKEDEKVCAIMQFGAVHGIGPSIAWKLYEKGNRSLSDLINEKSLTSAQRIALKFHNDINRKILGMR